MQPAYIGCGTAYDLPACDENSTSLASFKQLLNKVDLTCYTHSMVHDNVWFRIYSMLSHYVFYICFVSLVLTT